MKKEKKEKEEETNVRCSHNIFDVGLLFFIPETRESVAGKIDFYPPWGTGAINIVIRFFLKKNKKNDYLFLI